MSDFVTNVMDVYYSADAHEELWWRVRDGQLVLYAKCSDLFWWATADLERIEPEDLPLLQSAHRDLAAVDSVAAACYLSELFAARKRAMRPQRPCYKNWSPAVAALFDACGPERDPRDESWLTTTDKL